MTIEPASRLTGARLTGARLTGAGLTGARPMGARLPGPRLSRESVERVDPLTPVQQGMLFHELAAADTSPYHRQAFFRLRGTVDPRLTESVWNLLLSRHALLRSVFDYERTARPLRIVLKSQTVDFGFTDVSRTDAEAEIQAWRQQDLRRGFDLRRDRLIRVHLFKIGDDLFEMAWTHPHILLDGWSGAILMDEFAQLYAAALRGTEDPLPPAGDLDAYLAALATRDRDSASTYWRGLLSGYDTLATLPRAAPHAAWANTRPRPAEHRFRIGEAETAALGALASRHGVTLGIVLQALGGLLLGRWTDRRDVVFGIVVSGRTVATQDVDRLVGMFINSIPVRVRWEPMQDLGALLRSLQQQAWDGIEHDHAALADIQAVSEVPQGLLDHLLVLENYPPAGGTGAAVGFEVVGVETNEQANYDFGILVQAGAILDVTLPHDASRFPPGFMVRIECHLRRLLAQILAAPEALLSAFDPLPELERNTLAAASTGPVTRWPDGATLAELWLASARRTPDASALVDGAQRLTYRALDAAASGVAHRLLEDGVRPGDPVGVLAERSAPVVIALLGILKAGGVYLPLSPALPDARIGFMLRDAGCRLVLTDEQETARIARIGAALARPIAGPAARDCPVVAVGPEDPAYIIYTSGSTGQPKGVALAHRGFVNMILAQIEGFGIAPDDVVAQFASCTFDASLSEIFMALLAGACLTIVPDAAIRDGAAFLALLAAERITVATLPPSYLRALDGADLGRLRVLITAGEPPDLRDARHYARRLRYFNAYGPTETSVCASWHEVDPDTSYSDGIPIGRPIANTRMMVLDRQDRPMPIGAVGEICLAGPGLAIGYVGQPGLTAERFAVVNGERIYRTGDLGVVQDDGEVRCIGRRDFQVKLNGYRIEIGEIESRLRDHPSVTQAVVMVRGKPAQLVAYVVSDPPPAASALRLVLAESLPAWMIPTVFVPLAALPVTIAGKVDRHALPDPAGMEGGDDGPLDAAETLVAEAFASVLGGGSFGRRSSFSGAGGDSLRAIQLLGRLRRGGIQLDLRDLLAADTVAAIAALETRAAEATCEPVIGSAPLTPIQRWFFDTNPAGLVPFNHLVWLRSSVPLRDADALSRAVDAVWRQHDALRLTFRRGPDGWMQIGAAASAPPPPLVVDLRDRPDAWEALSVDAMARQDGFDLEAGPLFQTTLYRLEGGDTILLNAHHLVIDAVSWRIVAEDLELALRQALSGQSPELAGATTPYLHWATALSGWSGAERDRAYWQTVVGTEAASLPTDFGHAAHDYDETTLELADFGPIDPREPDRRIVARLLHALGATVPAPDKRRPARVLLSSHGRHPIVPGIDVSRTVGWFTVEFPFLVPAGSDADALEQSLAAVPSNGMSWSVLHHLASEPVCMSEPEISVNYLGVVDLPPDSLFRIDDGLPGVSVGRMQRRRLLEVEASVAGGRLAVGLRFAPRIHAAETIRLWLRAMADSFRTGLS
jgi:amino acid adenylation domain-containing protein